MRTEALLIGGLEISSSSGQCFEVYSPSTGGLIGRCERANAADVELAVHAARLGFASWTSCSPSEREAVLLRAADLLATQGEQRCLDLLIDESGSVISKARFEIRYSVDLLRTAAGEVRRLYGDTFPNDRNDRISMVFREPVGVVAVVSPYNAPLALLTKMAAFPLAAGNAIVIKPSEETPLIAFEFARILLEAGLPPKAVSVVTGFGKECGEALINHQLIDAIALTGSTSTGKLIGAQAMLRMCRAQLELGGKSALVVMDDVNADAAARIAVEGMFSHAGQICMANSRIIVAEKLFDSFTKAFKHYAEALQIGGDERDENAAYGPLINANAVAKIDKHVKQALADGAILLCGGSVREGLVYEPTALLNTPRMSGAWRDETFGPLTNIVSAASDDEALILANDSSYALSAAILTKDIQRGLRMARGLRSGAVHIGMHAFQSNALAPVGGLGDSGIGRSGGKYSTEEFTELKWISVELAENGL